MQVAVLILLVLVIVLSLINAKARAERTGTRRPCPHCAESILQAANVCPFCGRDVERIVAVQTSGPEISRFLLGLTLAIGGGIALTAVLVYVLRD